MKTQSTPTLAAVDQPRLVRHLKARAVIAGDLYREGKITRAECFRLEVDAAHGEDTGPIQYEDNDDHEFMMTGVGADHDEYRRRESMANTEVSHD
jgi:hypothetical protein